MKKNALFWITGIVLIAVLLLFVPSMFMAGRGNWMHNSNYGMMGVDMMGGWIVPIAISILVIATGVWLGNTLSNRNLTRSATSEGTCLNCKKPVNADWKTCPHCSTSLG